MGIDLNRRLHEGNTNLVEIQVKILRRFWGWKVKDKFFLCYNNFR